MGLFSKGNDTSFQLWLGWNVVVISPRFQFSS